MTRGEELYELIDQILERGWDFRITSGYPSKGWWGAVVWRPAKKMGRRYSKDAIKPTPEEALRSAFSASLREEEVHARD